MEIESELSSRFPAATSAEPDWDAVYAAELPRVYRCGNEALAEDLTSRTFEKAWRARHRYRRDLAGFGTWLLTIARNVAIDELRSERLHSRLEDGPELADGSTPEDQSAFVSDLERLVSLVERLPQRDREILAFKYGAEATNRTIAELTGLSESNVGTILHRAVQTLRELW